MAAPDLCTPYYNILSKAGSNLGFKQGGFASQEQTLLKFKLRKFSEEHLELRLRRKTGSINFKEFNRSKRIKVAIHDISTGITTTYDSIREACKIIDIDSKTF